MRVTYLVPPMLLISLCAFCEEYKGAPEAREKKIFFRAVPKNDNTLTKSYASEGENESRATNHERSVDFPTQIIRIESKIENLQLSCEQVNEEIEKTIIERISKDKFTSGTVVHCTFDPETRIATHFAINGYFDPINDQAIAYLNTYLQEYNGSDFLGTKLEIESAKGLVVSLNIAAGTKKNPDKPPFVLYDHDRSNFYFKSNYDMKNSLFSDVYNNFFSNMPDKILPFVDKWIHPYASTVYKTVLRDSNYVELQPERIFLMGHGKRIFISELKYYFVHNCAIYTTHHCL